MEYIKRDGTNSYGIVNRIDGTVQWSAPAFKSVESGPLPIPSNIFHIT